MSRAIKAIEHYIMSRTRPAVPPVRSQTRRGELGLQPSAPRLIAEWQQRGLETLSGYALHKLRLALAPSQSVITGGRLGGAMRGNHRSSRHAHWQFDKNRVGASEMELMKADSQLWRTGSPAVRGCATSTIRKRRSAHPRPRRWRQPGRLEGSGGSPQAVGSVQIPANSRLGPLWCD